MKILSQNELYNELGLYDREDPISTFYELNYKISSYLVKYRVARDLSQSQMADILGVKQPMVAKLESGEYNISLEKLCHIFSKLNVQVDIVIKDRPILIEDHVVIDSASQKIASEKVNKAVLAAC